MKLHHIVMWRLKEEALGKTRAANAKEFKRQLEALIPIIDDIIELRVGIDSEEAPEGNFDVVLESVFKDFNALSRYQKHPDHEKVVAFAKQIVAERTCVDYFTD